MRFPNRRFAVLQLIATLVGTTVALAQQSAPSSPGLRNAACSEQTIREAARDHTCKCAVDRFSWLSAFSGSRPCPASELLDFLNSPPLSRPVDTASNPDPAASTTTNLPQFAPGSIKMTMLFSDSMDPQ